jgi:glucan-binding YG repeat protein
MSPAMTHVRLESDVTLTVDGQSWERKADVQDDVAWFESPTFVITDGPIIEPELPELQNVKLEGDILTWEMDPDVFTYVLELNGKYGGAVESPCDLRVFCETFELDYGEYKGTLVGRNKDNKDVTRVTKFEYDYQPEHHTLVAFLESISGSSDFDEIDADKLFRYPTLTSETEDVSLHNMYYEKLLDDGTWRSTGFGTNQPFAPGTYRCKINAEIAREHYSDTAFWADKVELLMDGTPWTYGGPLGWNGDYCVAVSFYSPLIIVEEEKPVDPDDITGGRWYTKWGATYYETEDGENLYGLKKIDGDYYYFNTSGAMKKETFITIGKNKRYFGKDGKMVIDDFVTVNKATYYMNDEGNMATGITYAKGEWYYFRDSTGAMVKDELVTLEYDGEKCTYYLEPDGVMHLGFLTRWGVTRFFKRTNGIMQKGFVRIDKHVYYFRPENGAMVKNQFLKLDGYEYYLKADGTRAEDETLVIWGVHYVFNSYGELVMKYK